ncbi:RNA methyltransferase [Candidatus Micrarchaeota archaeon]|nr:RNA methyltransferase [Candidatus Micrarchaeota archaeon]
MGNGKGPQLTVVLAGVEYEFNLGMSVRAMKNFGVHELRIVEPACISGGDAIMYSKHAREVLEGAKRFGSLRGAVEDCDAAVGFSGILKRHKGSIRAAIPLSEFASRANEYSGKVALVFGREGIGLTKEEIGECDYLVHIESNPEYPVLNLSHAVAVALYALRKQRGTKPRQKRIGGREKEALIDIFKRLVGKYKFRNSARCVVAFRRVIGRANPTEKEGRSILNVLRVALEDIEGRGHEKDGAP